MFDLELQRRIREKKTPLALTLAPEAEKLNGKFVKNFIDMFGDTPMAQAEALRYHGTTLLDAAAGKLPAVVLRGGAYLRHGMMGADVLANLVSAAHAKELYVILDMNTAEPECWAGYGADAVTVCPYGGSGCLEAGEMLPIAAVRTGEPCQRGPCQGTVCDTGYEHRGAGVLGRVRGGRRDGVPLRRKRVPGGWGDAAHRGGTDWRTGAESGGRRPGAVAVRGGADGTPGCGAGCVHGVQSGCEGRAESMSGGVFAAGGL